jgi:uncharacterized protein (TIGR00369 family)
MEQSRNGFSRFADGELQMPPCAATLGAEIIEVANGESTAAFLATEQFSNPGGVVQGGFLAAMLDDTMGLATVSALPEGQFSTTIEMRVSFVRAARAGRLIGHGRVVHAGRSVVFTEASLTTESGELIATASSSLRVVRLDGAAP